VATATWRGAIEFGGFPINVALYNRVRKQRVESFRTLAPNGQPIKQFNKDSDGNEITTAECDKGVEVGKDKYVALTPEAIEQITEGSKSEIVQPSRFVKTSELPFELAIDRYAVRADEKVAGASQSTNVLWNGLRKSGLAYVTQITVRGGSCDAILAVYATDTDLLAVALPFENELYDVPSTEFTQDKTQAAMFERVVESMYKVEAFDHSAHHSEYMERRTKAIAEVLSGQPVVKSKTATTQPKADIMSLLEAAVTDAAKPKSRKKVAA
jgi:non-homologous end joining protein Ku